ncbi:MAG: superoxide dismutase [Turicibacter sp.]|nr:superoxide dismutase [Turicibacter sp.]
MSLYEMQPLGYTYDALEPHIDRKTIEIHYDQLYRRDFERLLWVVSKRPDFFEGKTMEQVLKDPVAIPHDIQKTVLDFGGSFVNHGYYFQGMSPNGGGNPLGRLARDINDQFGSFNGMKRSIKVVAQSIYESGWVWLVVNQDKKLDIIKTLTQANPVSLGLDPLIGIDLWEHAYWLSYPNKLEDYLAAFWEIVNLDFVEQKYEEIMK